MVGNATESFRKIRMRVMVRDDFTCQAHKLGLCADPCEETRLECLHVHHIHERQYGGKDDVDNLITLCCEHHAQVHPWMRRVMHLEQQGAEYPLREL